MDHRWINKKVFLKWKNKNINNIYNNKIILTSKTKFVKYLMIHLKIVLYSKLKIGDKKIKYKIFLT